jgi:hypothetical protein
MKKGVEILGEAPGEIRAGDGSGAATVAGANLRRVLEKIVNPEGIASEHRGPNPTDPTGPVDPTGPTSPTELTSPTKLRPLLDRPSDR